VKRCSKCKEYKAVEVFAKNRDKADGLQTQCKSCKAIQDHKYYKIHKTEHLQRVRLYAAGNQLKVWGYLKTHPCIDCGENNPVVLEFDHNGPTKKIGSISYLANTAKRSWSVIKTEIDKCEVRCANCHRVKTAKQLGWYKNLVP